MKEFLSIAAGVISFLSVTPYIIDEIRGKTKPNIVSWITWTILSGIVTAAAFAAHQPRTAFLTLGDGAATLIVVLLGFRYGFAKFTKFDAICQIAALAGIVLWLVLGSPLTAIVIAIAIDCVGTLPTLRHCWIDPQEETWQTFSIDVFASMLTLFSLAVFTATSLISPIYFLLINGAVVFIVVYRRKKLGISLSRSGIHETLHE